jgi:hypothetical protein
MHACYTTLAESLQEEQADENFTEAGLLIITDF